MKYLLLDTTKKSALIAVKNGDFSEKVILGEDMRHSEYLLTEIDKILSKLNLKLKDLDYMGVVTGPGSFTGIRIGVATLKAFAVTLPNCKFVSFNVFEAFSKEIKNGTMLLDCTKTSFYVGTITNCKLDNVKVLECSEALQINNLYKLIEEPLHDIDSYKNIKFIENYNEQIIKYFEECVKNKKFTDLKQIQPYYVQPSQAERELQNKGAKNEN